MKKYILLITLLANPIVLLPQTQSAVRSDTMQVLTIAAGFCKGPEAIAIDKSGNLFAGMTDGSIMRFSSNGNDSTTIINTGGRPLGLAIDSDNNIIACDAFKGLLLITNKPEMNILTNEHQGLKFNFPNDLSIAQDGKIYFSDSSSKYSIKESMQDEGQANGRLLVYDPHTKQTTLLLDSLYFANGVAVSSDQTFVLVCEMWKNQITRYWLKGRHKGQKDVFIDELPRYIDNITANEDGSFWLAIYPNQIFKLDKAGNIINHLVIDNQGFPPVTSAIQINDKLLLGNLAGDSIGIVQLN